MFLPLIVLVFLGILGVVVTKLTTLEAFDLRQTLLLLFASLLSFSLIGTFLRLSLTDKSYILLLFLNLRPIATVVGSTLDKTRS